MRNDQVHGLQNRTPTSLKTTLLTGATGFIGHYVLADLLARGERCLVLLRSPLDRSIRRLADLLAALGVDLERQVLHGRLGFVEGELGSGQTPDLAGRGLCRIVHCAGLTRLDEAEPQLTRRVNYDGAMQLLGLAQRQGIRDLHLVSTAYRCGRALQTVREDDAAAASFHNTYERSKSDAECAWRAWGRLSDASVTIYRPSIVVGDRAAGRVTRLAGVYLVARAVKMLADAAEHDPAIGERRVSIALAGRPECEQNLVPVDYVAKMIGYAVTHPLWHGRNYHLTHPNPPTNERVKHAIEQAFSLFGGRWSHAQPAGGFQQTFEQATAALRPYLEHQPRFDRRNAQALEHAAGLACPRYSDHQLVSLFSAANRDAWGRRCNKASRTSQPLDDYDKYFFRYLPDRLACSGVARATAVTCTMRFVLSDLIGADWTCRFVKGQLAGAIRTPAESSTPSDFTYLTTSELFWSALLGHADPQSVFLEGSAIVQGDLEQAMKMAVILREFNREFPCTRSQLLALAGPSREAFACSVA